MLRLAVLVLLLAAVAAEAQPRVVVRPTHPVLDAMWPSVPARVRPQSRLPAERPAATGARRLGGPRLGMTYLSPGVVERINGTTDDGAPGDRIDPSFPFITQFGWQFEIQTFRTPAGATGVAEIVPLLSGLDRGLLVPSLTVLSGVRTRSGLEVGAGPNVSLSPREGAEAPAGEPAPLDADVRLGLALVAGISPTVEGVTVPLTGAVVLGSGGPRVSLLVGLSFSDRRY